MTYTSYACNVDGKPYLVELRVDRSDPLRRDSFVYLNKQYLYTAKNTKSMYDLVANYVYKFRKAEFPVLQEVICQYGKQYYPELFI